MAKHNNSARNKLNVKKFISVFIIVLLLIVSIATIIAYLGIYYWLFDLFSHFRFQYAVVIILGIFILFMLKKRKIILLFLIPLILNAYDILPLYYGGNKNTELTNTVKICSINVLGSNRKVGLVEDYLKLRDPDIVIIEENNSYWDSILRPGLSHYAYYASLTREDNFGIAIYSKIKPVSTKQLKFGMAAVPSMLFTFNLENKAVRLLATHPPPPKGKVNAGYRNHQLKETAKFLSDSRLPTIVMGDLNISSFSPHFKSLVDEGNLIDSRRGFGILPTWPTWFPPLKITLDHCLITEDLQVKHRETGSYVGSDHLPIYVELGIK